MKYNIYLTFNENYFWFNSEVNCVRIYDNFENPIRIYRGFIDKIYDSECRY